MGILNKIGIDRLRSSLNKTRKGIFGNITRLVTAKSVIDDEVLDQLEETLIGADVGVDASSAIIDSIRQRVKNEKYATSQELHRLLKDEIQRQFAGEETDRGEMLSNGQGTPYVILVVGVNGVGKTTTIGKLAHSYVKQGKKVTLAAGDTFRAAANEQLDIWSKRAGVSIVRHPEGGDPAAVAFDAVQSGAARRDDIVIIDTAGRLHTRVNLMEELKKVKRVMKKQNAEAPHEVLLVLDASTGQNAIEQARQFNAAVGVTGLVLTKLDGTAKGGVVLAITRSLKIPVRYIGVGEQIDDLQPFSREAFVDALFGEDITEQ